MTVGGYSGGIVGKSSSGTISGCTNYANILGSRDAVGGICGTATNTTFTKCANLCKEVKTTGGSSASNTSKVGGIVGRAHTNTNITKSYNKANIIGSGAAVGGITGSSYQGGTITQCYNTGMVQSLKTDNGGNSLSGGIVGYAGNSVNSCYNMGDVKGTKSAIGGIIGSNINTGGKQEVKNCYSIGTIATGVIYRGGIAGDGKGISNCYFLQGKASYAIGASTATTGSNTTNVTYKTQTQLKRISIYFRK